MDFESEAKVRCNFQFDKQDVIDFTKFSSMTGPQKQIHKSSCRSFVFWAKKLQKAAFSCGSRSYLVVTSKCYKWARKWAQK